MDTGSDNEKAPSDYKVEDTKERRKKTPEEQKEALDKALEIDPGVERWSARAFQLYLVTLIVAFCAGDSGFDGTVMGGINAMHQYQQYFDLSGADARTGIVFGIFTVGAIPASWVPDRFGRRFGMFLGNGLLMIGAIISAMADRFGSALGGAAAKSYLAEITPPQTRGAYLGFLNSFYYVGQMTATGMMVSTGNFATEWSWRLPLFVQVVPAALNFLFIFTCPESPRWLYSRGKKEQAANILARFHSSNGDPNSPLVALELEEIEERISLDGADKRWWDFRPLFRRRSDRYRTFMVVIIGFFGQLSGNGLITYFLPLLLKNAGITSQHKQLVLNFTGRRNNLLFGTGALVVILAIITGLLSETGNAARSNAGITFIYLFMVVFSFGWTAMQALYPAEVLSYEARTKGLAFLGICSQSAQLITTFAMPSAISALTWKIYLIYMVWDIFEWLGQTLSSPATQKFSESGGNARFQYAVTEMQGWRITMEDAHAIVLDLDGEKDDSNTFFAVYDGHGGSTVARFAGQNVHQRLVKEEAYKESRYDEALKRAFLGTDEDLLANPAHTRDPSGATAVAALVTKDKIYVANAGDSRSVLSVKGEVKPLSFDHKPSNEVEKTRISGAGGYIEFGRVNGNLALSRALGDFEFKKNYNMPPEKQIITSDPDITCHDITDEDEFLVLACDGIWDCLSSQQVVNFIRYQVSEGKNLTEIGEMMCEHCLAPDTSSGAGIGCDNMTILIIAILNGRTMEEWAAWITDRVKNEYGFKTPNTLPQLYAQSRLMSFKVRREAQEARDRARQESGGDEMSLSGLGFGAGGLGQFARVLGSTGGISFHPGSAIMGDNGPLMFGSDDSEDDESEEDLESGGRSYFKETILGRDGDSTDPMHKLQAQLDAYEKDVEDPELDEDVDLKPHEDGAPETTTSSTPNEPPKLANGDAVPPAEQLSSTPAGDAPHPAVAAEGLMDTSEDPLKGF
ncbi:putative general substrate transporter [Favolaschia claudopus]|uniref:protein-serine/threonine phosphatase n=1 Tax=Favolaschia claudopus TaxID=2862362 RepID=A0AAW0DAY3_9AGAR